MSFYTLIITRQGHISGVAVIFEFSNGCLKFCLKLFFTNLTIVFVVIFLKEFTESGEYVENCESGDPGESGDFCDSRESGDSGESGDFDKSGIFVNW